MKNKSYKESVITRLGDVANFTYEHIILNIIALFVWLLCIPITGVKFFGNNMQGKNANLKAIAVFCWSFLFAMPMSMMYIVSHPASAMYHTAGVAKGIIDTTEYIETRIPNGVSRFYKNTGADHAVALVGDATGLRQETPLTRAKQTLFAPFKWIFGAVKGLLL
jgi:hypothetical protein